MLYLAVLIIFGVSGAFALQKLLVKQIAVREILSKKLGLEYINLEKEKDKFKEDNLLLEEKINETIALYNMAKDICKTLDQERIFGIFKERIKELFENVDCVFLPKDADLSPYKGFITYPLVIQLENAGYLAANGVSDKDKERFGILAWQFLIGAKRALLYQKMQELAITDSLTRLFSRRHFLERLAQELTRSKEFKYKFSFLMADIDKFKDLNDRYGHLVGDAVLREVSRAIKESTRQIDFVGRYGGEELSIILVETPKEEARSVAERIRKTIELKDFKVYDETLKVTLSIGLATFPSDGINVKEVIEAADSALYLAKARGRNRIEARETK